MQSSPILICPDFSVEFNLCTDTSDSGLGAVLQQGNQVVAYASRTLNKAEKQYSVIEKECLALVYAVKQFRHYLLGQHFTIFTDHNPLIWLSSQKMQGKLARWALSLQEYSFTIKYRKGSSNRNADSLSRITSPESQHCATTELKVGPSREEIKEHQSNDPVISEIIQHINNRTVPEKSPLFNRWLQLWPQLKIQDGILYRTTHSPGTNECSNVIVLPTSLHRHYLQQFHDAVSAGHQGYQKTLERLKRFVYWVGMAIDVRKYCESCDICQCSKPPLPRPVPMVNVPIGKPWEFIAVDILKVPPSFRGNTYLLVLQDYFTKWLEAVPLADQKAETIVKQLVKIFSTFGMPKYLHSDQGTNFESTILQKTCAAFGIIKTRTTAYHPQGDGMVERSNRSILQMLRSFTSSSSDWEDHLPLLLFAYRTSFHRSTKATPFTLMFGRDVADSIIPTDSTNAARDTITY